jgi:Ca2+-binding EF-hand superfamily protein
MSKNKAKTIAFDLKSYEDRGISTEDVKQIKEAFDLFDSDRSGEVDTKELKEALTNIGLTTESSTLRNIMDSLDKDRSGSVSFDEFFDLLATRANIGESEADLQKVFDLFTGSKSDYIDLETLRQIARELSDLNMTESEMKEMIKRADSNNDGKVTFKDFFNIMTKKLN